jgi:DNA-directed RNA polymerase subunit beta'
VKNDLLKFFDKPTDPLNFDSVRISVASSEKIRSWSYGEVKKPETINYRTFKPEREGLFCAKIFGPVRDFECICGKYKRMKHRGIVCDKCGVEVIHSKVRRERLGHINLATPVGHIWFLKSLPSRIGTILDIALKDLERILYSEAYVVLDPGDASVTKLVKSKVVTEDEYEDLVKEHGNGSFRVGVGGEAILELLKEIKVDDLVDDLRRNFLQATSDAARKKLQKRLKVSESFLTKNDSGEFACKPEWMMLNVVPVQPPDLRPLVPLDGGRFATSDLNDLYRRVINRNNRLQRLVELGAPDIIIRNEKRMLQESVDALFDNGRRGRVFTGPNKRPLRSLSDFLKGKQGRFRQNLLGKRVDYSGRSVIVVGPDLKLHQCGIPKQMAVELFKPFLYAKLEEYGVVSTIKSAKKLVEKGHSEIWDILEEITKEHPVLLNRAPTLHRLGIQAFEPVLIEGKAIRLHPLVCFAFNADFDGDQMAVHVPLSVEAQMEARVLMMSTNNILSPASGSPVIVPSQDIVLGIYYLTRESLNAKGAGKVFSSLEEVRCAYDHDEVGLQAPVRVRLRGDLISTTVGRGLFSEIVPKEIPFEVFNKVMGKKELATLVEMCFHRCGPKRTVLIADSLRTLGYSYSTRAGMSIAIGDMVVPDEKEKLLTAAESDVQIIKEQYSEGLLTEGERYNKVVDIWANVTEQIADSMFANIASMEVETPDGRKHTVPSDNSIFMMADSGARGSAQQIRQLAGMRGLMSKPSGEIIETPITANFREGLTVLQYFTSTHGARKGLADTALKTASSGYLTRRLVDVAQDAIIFEEDCGSNEGIKLTPVREGGDVQVSLYERILGRTLAGDLKHPVSGEVVYDNATLVDENIGKVIEKTKVEEVKVRSLLTCNAARGVCAKCYGRDLSFGGLVNVGEAVGVIAAQSIGEPGTQLTMRTFHFGGTATHKVENNSLDSRFSGSAKYLNLKTIKDRNGKNIAVSRAGEVQVIDIQGELKESYPIVYGATLLIKDGDPISAGETIVEWDPFSIPMVSEHSGKASYVDLIDNKSLEETVDEITFLTRKVVVQSATQALKPSLEVETSEGKKVYNLSVGAIINVDDGNEVSAGDVIAKLPREASKTKDITGGLPRVAELFEARIPKDAGVMSEHSGIISFGDDYKEKRRVVVTSSEAIVKEYLVPKGRNILVAEGDYIRKGEFLVDGPPNPHDILGVLGPIALGEFLVDKVQEVYRLQGVKINDKHIEVIVRQMLRRFTVVDEGDSKFFIGESVSRLDLFEENKAVIAKEGKPAQADCVLLGITKASLATESFISAASFQETTKVLTQASISSKVDKLKGLKENVIMGRLIPSGTGTSVYRGLTAVEASNLSLKDNKDLDDSGDASGENIEDTISNLLGDGEES